MARQYSILDFLRRAPNNLLKEFLSRFGIGGDIDWDYLSPKNVEPLFKAISADVPIYEQINLAFQEIHDLADETGILTILKEARESDHGLDLSPALKDMSSCYEKAFWVYMNHPNVFKSARIMDTIDDRRSVRRGGFPMLTYDLDETSKERLGKALSEHYLKRDGRGQGYTVDYYRRGDSHLYYAYLEGFAHAKLVYDENHELKNDSDRPAFEIIFRYNAAKRTLDISGASGKRVLNELQMLFSEVVLRNKIPAPPDRLLYDLDGLRSRDFDLPIDFELSLQSARVKKLKVNVWGRQGITVTIDVGKDYGLPAILDILDAIVAAERLPKDMIEVKRADFGLVFYPEEGKSRGKPFPFSVSSPDTTSLKEGRAADDKARRCIVEWGIDVSGSADSAADEPPLPAQSLLDY